MKPGFTCKALLVPFPITPLAALDYCVCRRLGLVGPTTFVRYHNAPGHGLRRGDHRASLLGDGDIWSLSGSYAVENLETLITANYTGRELWLHKRLLSFCLSRTALPIGQWLLELSLVDHEPGKILEIAAEWLSSLIDRKIDPWKSLPTPPAVKASSQPARPDLPPDKRFLDLPVFKSRKPSEGEVIDHTKVTLTESKVWSLCGAGLGLVVGGPAGAGKSTLVASLAGQMQNIVQSLASRRGWEGFNLNISSTSLDLATPTLEAIQTGHGRNRENLALAKRPWTSELAWEGLARFKIARESNDITIADLPGQITNITATTTVLADTGIILAKNWETDMPEWKELFNQMGVNLVCQARSRETGDPLTSVVTRYQPGQLVAGRVTSLDRVNRSWDLFISILAELLLFDILPAFVQNRQETIRKQLAQKAKTGS